jgi:hypothetical protein
MSTFLDKKINEKIKLAMIPTTMGVIVISPRNLADKNRINVPPNAMGKNKIILRRLFRFLKRASTNIKNDKAVKSVTTPIPIKTMRLNA